MNKLPFLVILISLNCLAQTETTEYIKRLENDQSVSISYVFSAINAQFDIDAVRDRFILKSGVDEIYWIGFVGGCGLVLTNKLNFSLLRWQNDRITITPRLFLDSNTGETKGLISVKL